MAFVNEADAERTVRDMSYECALSKDRRNKTQASTNWHSARWHGNKEYKTKTRAEWRTREMYRWIIATITIRRGYGFTKLYVFLLNRYLTQIHKKKATLRKISTYKRKLTLDTYL